VVGAVAGIFVFWKSIEDIALYTNFATLLVFAGVNTSAMRLFTKTRTPSRRKNILADIVLPSLGVAASLWLATSIGWRAALFGLILLGSGVLAYFVFNRLRVQTKT
jgi:amino acid transporter